MKKILTTILILLFITAIILEIENVYYMNKIATDSIYAAGIKKQIEELDKKNSILKIEILGFTSYQSLTVTADKLGFVEPKDFIYLSMPLRIAANKNEQP